MRQGALKNFVKRWSLVGIGSHSRHDFGADGKAMTDDIVDIERLENGNVDLILGVALAPLDGFRIRFTILGSEGERTAVVVGSSHGGYGRYPRTVAVAIGSSDRQCDRS